MTNKTVATWDDLSIEEKRNKLFLQQKETLDAFRARHAITEQDYQKGLNALLEKLEGDEKLSF